MMADKTHRTTIANRSMKFSNFPIPKGYKLIFARALKVPEDAPESEHILVPQLREIFNTGVTSENYIRFFHTLLWYEETIARINLKKYNMNGVHLDYNSEVAAFALYVPGLAEKRPSLLPGDLILLKPHQADTTTDVMYEGVVSSTNENIAHLQVLNDDFFDTYNSNKKYGVRFTMSQLIMERMHEAVHSVWESKQSSRVFPQKRKQVVTPKRICKFFNPMVGGNVEQRMVVEHIVAGSSGLAPYLVHGPPGTGKTVTVVEAVLQLIHSNPNNRIMVCTDSNTAADNVATMLIKYADRFTNETFLLRANSNYRSWETLPDCLIKYSNGHSSGTFYNVEIQDFMAYSIVITTLLHAAKYARELKKHRLQRHITHLFIDEAGQSSEPSTLIPICGLLKVSGTLVLAGDPLQLGPVVISHDAKSKGLGLSLMERLKRTCELYSDNVKDPHYTVMLRNNFRSDSNILVISNQLFYEGQLKPCAPIDKLSEVDIMGERVQSRSLVFHGVLSKEEKIEKSPSFFNPMEVELVQMYVNSLIRDHDIAPEDIGIVTPYIRQVYHIKKWLQKEDYHKIEVGTVEAYQGKEKRVIIISTVRANCDLLGHDAKFQLGFLVDDKRFNVALTRAKAKAIVIGNPLCLQKDAKWRMLMDKCREDGTYYGVYTEHTNAASEALVSDVVPVLKQLNI